MRVSNNFINTKTSFGYDKKLNAELKERREELRLTKENSVITAVYESGELELVESILKILSMVKNFIDVLGIKRLRQKKEKGF